MPRHNLAKYNPAGESTPGLKTEAAERKALCLNTKSRVAKEGDKQPKGTRTLGCPCGCEGEPFGGKRTFLMGHDARLRGKLIRAHLTDTPVARFIDGTFKNQRNAMQDAKEYGDSFVKALAEAGERVSEANKALLQKAMGSKRLIKVGKSEFTGQVVAVFEARGGAPDRVEVEYVDRSGKTKRTKVNKSDAPVATKADEQRIAKANAPKPKSEAKKPPAAKKSAAKKSTAKKAPAKAASVAKVDESADPAEVDEPVETAAA